LLYTATAEDGSGPWLYVMDLENRTAQRATIGVEKYTSVAASGDGRRLAVSVANPTASLWTVPISDSVAGEAAVNRYPVPTSRAIAPRLVAGALLYLSSRGGADGLWKSQGGHAVELWKGADGVVTEAPAVSPDGSTLCFSYRKGGKSHLYLMSMEGTNMRPLAPFLDVEGSASWSADGKWIAVSADAGEGVRLFKVPVDGVAPVALVDIRTNDPVWSPDGRLIVYEQATGGSGRIIKAVTPEGEPFPLPVESIATRAGGDRYRFLPDGKGIVLSLGDFRRQNFWLLDLKSKQLRQLTNLRSGFSTRGFDITPDGKEIVFDRVQENSDIVLIDLARE
jgi:Tol biopolymer transport system component